MRDYCDPDPVPVPEFMEMNPVSDFNEFILVLGKNVCIEVIII
jgi:hypothetical protein